MFFVPRKECSKLPTNSIIQRCWKISIVKRKKNQGSPLNGGKDSKNEIRDHWFGEIEYRLSSKKLGVVKCASQYNLERMVLPTIFIETWIYLTWKVTQKRTSYPAIQCQKAESIMRGHILSHRSEQALDPKRSPGWNRRCLEFLRGKGNNEPLRYNKSTYHVLLLS